MIAQAVQQYGVPEKLILSHIRKMDDNALLEKARQYAPDLVDQVDEDTLKRALVVIRE
jgi:oligoribonuclease (3'-5' exoribonuclease)